MTCTCAGAVFQPRWGDSTVGCYPKLFCDTGSELSWKQQGFLCSSVTSGCFTECCMKRGDLLQHFPVKAHFLTTTSPGNYLMLRKVLKRKKKKPQIRRFKPGLHVMFGLGFFGRNTTELQICRLHVRIPVLKKNTVLADYGATNMLTLA